MAKFRVKVSGDLAKQFKGLEDKLKQTLHDELYSAALEIEGQYKAALPVDTGVLKASTGVREEGLTFTIFNKANYAAYIEFGTINYVYVPTEMTEVAAPFKGAGIRTTGGIRARPHMYTAFKVVTRDLLPKVDKALQTELLRIK